MADENWQKVREIFDAALRQNPEERRKFVRRACGTNKTLLADVESLLASLDSAESFMEQPAIAGIAGQMLSEDPQFSKGQFLNHYEIIRQIGAGGMGDVYLAQDTKLARRVALKILRENLLSDKHANRRLLREAQAAALLEHPNICAIYEISETDDCSFIVMQYVEGETLANRLFEKPLRTEESLDLAIQIADALSEAHARGIIHRDIKPANIIVNQKRQAKVLDFGLAKIVEAEEKHESENSLPSSGSVMGTVPYMSPEQLCGKKLDARTDIFSFGALFFEMMTGRQAFAGESDAERISAILKDQPAFGEIPQILQPIVRKCLMKSTAERYQTAQDLLGDLLGVKQNGDFSSGDKREQPITVPTARLEPKSSKENARPVSKSPRIYFWKSAEQNAATAPSSVRIENEQAAEKRFRRLNFSIILPVLLIIGAAALIYWQFIKTDSSENFDALRPARLADWKSGANSLYTDYRISNNGKMIAFSSTQSGGNEAVYVKQTTDGEDIRVTKDERRSFSPLWSPDDQYLAFVSVRENEHGIYVCPSFGGSTKLLKLIEPEHVSLRHWSKNGTAIFYEMKGNLFRLDLTSLEIVSVTDFAESSDDRNFSFSPDESQIVFCDRFNEQTDIWTMPVKGGEPFRLTNDADKETRPLWHADGKRILYNVARMSDMQINLVRADASLPVQVTRGGGNYELIDLSPDGTKIFYTSWEKRSDVSRIETENGQETEYATEIESEMWATLSPDGKSIVYQTNSSPRSLTNLHESSLVIKPVKTVSPPLVIKGYNPKWLPDSRRVAFLRWHEAEQKYQYWLVNITNGETIQITTNGIASPTVSSMPISRNDPGNNWSHDATRFVYLDFKKQNIFMASPGNSGLLNLTNNSDPNTRFFPPQFSPDGKRVVYLSTQKPAEHKRSVWLNEQGKVRELFSTEAYLHLLGWSASGNEIFLAMTDGVMKVSPLDVKLLEISINGGSRVLTTFKNAYAKSLAFSTEGKTIAFVARQNEKDDIWIAPLGNGEPKKLTANVNMRLFYANLSFSPDDKTILFDKQDQINSISVLENFK